MAGNDDPGTPPEVPEEYAAIYRDAYLRALAEDGQPVDHEPPGPSAPPLFVDEVVAYDAAEPEGRRSGWLLPALIGAAVVVVVLGVVVVSQLGGGTSAAPPAATGNPTGDRTGNPSATTPGASAPATPAAPDDVEGTAPPTPATAPAYDGSVTPVALDGVTATCTAKPGVDSAGRPVRYDATNADDADPTTAWRCDGSAVGEKLTLTLPAGTEVGEVGLIPGYAKTDPSSKIDRYAENNRITRVRWTLADGVVVEQTLDPDPKSRAVQLLRVPRTQTASITLEILAVDKGARDTTAISQIEISAAS
ncbi:MAG: hypothetical protein JWQ74_2463 [Marmoricola sp.]|nr:hypothetical protein [Marmoricola sp.]